MLTRRYSTKSGSVVEGFRLTKNRQMIIYGKVRGEPGSCRNHQRSGEKEICEAFSVALIRQGKRVCPGYYHERHFLN
jgi:hypothetical protein